MEQSSVGQGTGAVRRIGSLWRKGDRPRLREAADVPALEARRNGLAEHLESVIYRLYPFVVSFVTANVLSLVLSAVAIGVGLGLTNFIVPIGAVDRVESGVPGWLEQQRTPLLDDLSYVASMFGADFLVLLVVVTALAFATLRHWRIAGFVLAAILVEVTSYRVVADVVGRARPEVVHMDVLNPMHSFPSGHVAASVAIYGGLAMLLTSRFRSVWARIPIWSLAVALPFSVAVSRLYRGEHHPLDVVGGALLGVGALAIALLATRAAVVADERRRPLPDDGAR
jgi:membrane-associated phospholipid phosphatase